MPKSKNRANHKQKVNNFKTKKQEQMNQQNAAQAMPPVRTIPTWTPDSTIEIKGFEWEAIQNALGSLNFAMQAAQSVMSRNILNGTITMDFEKLDPATLQYVAMDETEKAEHREQFAQQIAAFKQAQAAAQNTPQQEAVPAEAERLVEPVPTQIVDPAGNPVTTETPTEGAKVINLDGSK
jgi:hypothetical protein